VTDRHLERLVARAARRDASAFGRLYDEFADRIYGFIRVRVRDPRDAEELTETVFLKAWEAIPDYEQRGLPFPAWLFRIARNTVIDFARSEARKPAVAPEAEAEEMAAEVRLDEEVLAKLDAERVREAVRRLTEEQSAVVTMRFLWGFSLKEAALVLGATEGAVKALQHRALRSLARILAEETGDARS
jgi:RNA polymerase sigma-70 factor (ECF subfamily)